MAAVIDEPSLIGAGLVDPGEFIAPYQGGASFSPHNSFLTIAIRVGILGGIAYILLIGSSLLSGLLEILDVDRSPNLGVLALATGFTAHQQFEAYTLFNWNSSTVLAVFVFGFLVFGTLNQEKGAGIGYGC